MQQRRGTQEHARQAWEKCPPFSFSYGSPAPLHIHAEVDILCSPDYPKRNPHRRVFRRTAVTSGKDYSQGGYQSQFQFRCICLCSVMGVGVSSARSALSRRQWGKDMVAEDPLTGLGLMMGQCVSSSASMCVILQHLRGRRCLNHQEDGWPQLDEIR